MVQAALSLGVPICDRMMVTPLSQELCSVKGAQLRERLAFRRGRTDPKGLAPRRPGGTPIHRHWVQGLQDRRPMYLGIESGKNAFWGRMEGTPLNVHPTTLKSVHSGPCAFYDDLKKPESGIPGWRSGLAPAFGPGRDPGDLGSNSTSGSRCMEPASPSACVSASFSLSLCDYNK